MAFVTEVGSVSLPASTTGNLTVSLSNFTGLTPKAVIFWMTHLGTITSTEGQHSLGFATYRSSSVQQFASACQAQDNAGSSDTSNAYHESRCILAVDQGAVIDLACSFVSFGSNQFTINRVTIPSSATTLHYLVLGGSDLSDANIVHYVPTVSATYQVTTVGFQPDAAVTLPHDRTAVSGSGNAYGAIGFSFWDGTTERSTQMRSRNARPNMDAYTEDTNDAILQKSAAGSIRAKGSFSQWLSNGVELNITTASTGRRISTLFLKGGNYKVGTAQTAIATGNIDSSIGFNATGVLYISASKSVRVHSDHVGALQTVGASDGTNHGSGSYFERTAIAAAQVSASNDATKSMAHYDYPFAALKDLATSSFSVTDTLRTSFTGTDTAQRYYHYMAFGTSATSINVTLTPSVLNVSTTEQLPISATIINASRRVLSSIERVLDLDIMAWIVTQIPSVQHLSTVESILDTDTMVLRNTQILDVQTVSVTEQASVSEISHLAMDSLVPADLRAGRPATIVNASRRVLSSIERVLDLDIMAWIVTQTPLAQVVNGAEQSPSFSTSETQTPTTQTVTTIEQTPSLNFSATEIAVVQNLFATEQVPKFSVVSLPVTIDLYSGSTTLEIPGLYSRIVSHLATTQTILSSKQTPTTATGETQTPLVQVVTTSSQAPVASMDTTQAPATQVVTIAEQAPNASSDATQVLTVQSLAVAEQVPTLSIDTTQAAVVQVITIGEQAPTFTTGMNYTVTEQVLAATEQAPSVSLGTTQNPTTQIITLSEQAPNVSAGNTQLSSAQNISTTEQDPVVIIGQLVVATEQIVTGTEQTPTYQLSMTQTPTEQIVSSTELAPLLTLSPTTNTLDLLNSIQAPSPLVRYAIPSSVDLVSSTQNPEEVITHDATVTTVAVTEQAPLIVSNIGITVLVQEVIPSVPNADYLVSVSPLVSLVESNTQAPTIIASDGITIEPSAYLVTTLEQAPTTEIPHTPITQVVTTVIPVPLALAALNKTVIATIQNLETSIVGSVVVIDVFYGKGLACFNQDDIWVATIPVTENDWESTVTTEDTWTATLSVTREDWQTTFTLEDTWTAVLGDIRMKIVSRDYIEIPVTLKQNATANYNLVTGSTIKASLVTRSTREIQVAAVTLIEGTHWTAATNAVTAAFPPTGSDLTNNLIEKTPVILEVQVTPPDGKTRTFFSDSITVLLDTIV